MADGFGYASRTGRSAAQEAHVQARLAQLAAHRRNKRVSQEYGGNGGGGPFSPTSPTSSFIATTTTTSPLKRTTSGTGSTSTVNTIRSNSTADGKSPHAVRDIASSIHSINNPSSTALDETPGQHGSLDLVRSMMEPTRANTSSSSGGSMHTEHTHESLLRNPYDFRNGRRYLREVPYPLPCDLSELHRQNLRTLLTCKVLGRAVCCPNVENERLTRVLEVGCGTGYWSAMCHDYLSRSQGLREVEYVGIDIAPLPPNLGRSGMRWRFVQHDIRRVPLPFDDGEFDLIMIKDMSMAIPLGAQYQQFLGECVRLLREGGAIEVWETDHIIRTLLPHPPPAPMRTQQERDIAEKTGTYCLTHGTPFSPSSNRYFRQANSWIAEALERRKLPPAPCVQVARLLSQEPDLRALGSRRVAVPLSEFGWEHSSSRHNSGELHDSPMSTGSRAKGRLAGQPLNDDQLALRQTALMTVLQMIESMEPLICEVSGKTPEEWAHWWSGMMSTLSDPNQCSLTGESLELGVWWATKQRAQ